MTFFSSSSPYFGRSSTGDGAFADPFNDLATQQMPTTMKSALWWSEYIWLVNGTFRMAMKRVLSYFLTEPEVIGEASDNEKQKYRDKLNDDLSIMSFLNLALEDRLAYGNSFLSVLIPFRRYLISPKSGDLYPLDVVYNKPEFNFQFSGEFEFIATCPKTGWRGPWIVEDKPKEEAQQLVLKRWNVHEIEILHDMFTDQVAYLWRIPETYKRTIRDGSLFHLERVPLQVLKAIKEDKLFRFNDGAIYHLKAPTLAGIRNLGWGLPASLNNFRQIWYLQVLRRYNEAIALDYVIPFRLITPEPRNGSTGAAGVAMNDPMTSFNGGDLNSMFRQMVAKRRKDPASFQFLPFPVKYQMLGADAKQLAPTELIEQGYDTLLNESGVPVEFYKGSLSVQAAPVALRLFESTHRQLVAETNSCLQWLVDTISKIMSWEHVKCRLERVTMADDLDKQMAALQLMMGQQLSGTSGLKAIGYNWEDEQKLIGEEAIKQQQIQARIQEEAEQAGFAAEIARGNNPNNPAMQQGQPGQGGDPNAQGGPAMAQQGGMPVTDYIQSMGPNANVTPAEMQQAAEMLASQLLGLPEGVKDSQLRELKKSNEVLHSVVRSKMDQMRQQFKTQGGAMLMQQQQGQPPA